MNEGIVSKKFIGNTNDLPIPADFNGDNKYEQTIWRPSIGAWFFPDGIEENTEIKNLHFQGNTIDSPFSVDYDGDHKSDLGVWRPEGGFWYIDESTTHLIPGNGVTIQNGQEWDVIVPNDYDGDGRCDLVLWRKSNQTWYLKYAKDGSQNEIKFGGADDIPASGDVDGDGIPELIT